MKNSTLIVVWIRCRLFLFSIDVSSADVSFDGDNEIEDTVRLTRFLFDCSIDADDEVDDWVAVIIDSVVLFVGVGGFVDTSVVTVVDPASSAERTVS